MPRSETKTDEMFVIHNRAGEPIKNKPYKITLTNGDVIEGVTDAQGHTKLVKEDAVLVAALKFKLPEIKE